LLRNLDVDHRADIYSLGVVFYEMLTGELPVVRFAPPGQRAQVDARLDAIVLRALESKPEHRYQDAAEIKRDIEAIFAGPLVPAAARADWPCVRFTIPRISWTGARVEGQRYRDETTLILDFGVVSSMGSSTHKEVRVPLADLMMISLHKGTRPNVPHWLSAWVPPQPEIVLKANSPAALAELPAGQHGRGRLEIHPGDLEAAQQLVDSIIRDPIPRPAEKFPVRASPVIDNGRIRKQLLAPALGLALTAVVALVSTPMLAVVLARRFDPAGDVLAKCLVGAVVFVCMPLGVWLLIAGAVRMLRERSYTICLAAAVVAMLPWSPTWPLGLTVGIWAVAVLGRRDVVLSFFREGDSAAPESPRDAEPPGPVADKLRSWCRSFAGYFVSIRGTRSRAQREGASSNDG